MSRVVGLFGVFALAAIVFVVSQLGSGQPEADSSQLSQEEFLPVDEAFAMHATTSGERVRIHWDIHPGYYLYQERMFLDSVSDGLVLGEAEFDRDGQMKDDPTFGPQRVYFDEVALNSQIISSSGSELKVLVSFQGCAESGLCYPPTSRPLTLSHAP